MKIIQLPFLFLLVALTCHKSFGENRPDTLNSQIIAQCNDTLMFKTFIDLYKHSFYDDFQKSRRYLDSAIIYAEKSNDPINLATTYGYYGVFYRFAGAYIKSRASTKRSEKYLEQLPNRRLHSMNLYNLGTLALINGNYEEAMKYFLRHLEINEQMGNWISVGEAYNNISIVYKETGDSKKSLDYLHLSLQKFKKAKSQYNIGLALGNIASQYQILNEWDSVIKYALATRDIGELINSDQTLGFSNQVLAEAYIGKREFRKAAKYAQKSLDNYKSHPESRLIFHSYVSLGQAQSNLGNYADATKYLTIASRIADTLVFLEGQNIVLKYLADNHARFGHYEQAFNAYQKHKGYSDSITSSSNTELVNDLNLKYETSKKDAQINEQELEIERRANQRNLYLFGLGVLSLVAAFLFGQHRYSQKLSKEKITRLKQLQKLSAIENVLQGEENERERIAKDLHDGLGGLLATAKLQLHQTQKQKVIDQSTPIAQAEKIIEEPYEEVRRISHDMMPSALTNLGLKSAIEDLADKVNISQMIKVVCQLYMDDSKMSKPVQIAFYRIIQESLNNSLKHAQASQFIIQITESKYGIHLTVEDDGRGFDFESVDTIHGLGMKSIESRVKYLGGTISLDSQIDQGTSIDIFIPKTDRDVDLI